MPDMNMQVFEEAQRNQLVTEVDIQTQVALDDYQVQLSDVANPTQSQDNVVIDRFGEFLSHWNESLDFDTWVKMSMEIAGKRLLMLRGNSNVNSASNITNTMIFGDDFPGSSIDTGKWDGDTACASVSGGLLTVTGNGSARYLTSITHFNGASSAVIGTFGGSTLVGSTGDHFLGFTDAANVSTNEIRWYPQWTANQRIYHNGVITVTDNYDSGDDDYTIKWKSGNSAWFRDGVEGTNSPETSNVPNYSLPIVIRAYDNGVSWTFEYVYVRKYTATEPTNQIGTPKNISTALKSFGRVG